MVASSIPAFSPEKNGSFVSKSRFISQAGESCVQNLWFSLLKSEPHQDSFLGTIRILKIILGLFILMYQSKKLD